MVTTLYTFELHKNLDYAKSFQLELFCETVPEFI